MPPHTSLQYTMPSNNTTNSKATSASSYIFAPSWLTNLNNKTGPATTILSPAHVSTIEGNSNTNNETNEEEVVVVGSKNRDGLGVIKQVRDNMVKDSNSSLSSPTPRTSSTSTRPKSRDFSLLTTLEETESNEETLKAIHGRARSVSQANPNISSSPTSFDRNFPTLAKNKQISLSVDLPAKNVDNMWANSDIKSKLLSPTTYNHLPEDSTKLNNNNIDNEPELERRMSLVPKVESGKLDGKRTIIKQSMKRKTSRSLSMDSVARSQHFRPYLRETVGLSSRRLSVGNNPKYNWSSNLTMGKMGHFKILSEDEEDILNYFLTEQINDIGSSSSIEYNQINDDNLENSNSVPQSPVSTSLEREEKFLRQLGWQKPYEKDDDSSQWAITEEEKRLFINLVRALSGGVSINEKRISKNTSLSNGEINRAKRNWAAAITIKKQEW
ncbi:2624_t:CDS:2 [Diversispora eburnea]|uniref:2624_t:CDS:1 n=2 Tax=Diversisporales TaxID=214509 RepID=A0A9N9B0L4_9GLOM|nr:2624_t:CDS:2 [Diversispora eburnea]